MAEGADAKAEGDSGKNLISKDAADDGAAQNPASDGQANNGN